jgi:hypothetical protein
MNKRCRAKEIIIAGSQSSLSAGFLGIESERDSNVKFGGTGISKSGRCTAQKMIPFMMSAFQLPVETVTDGHSPKGRMPRGSQKDFLKKWSS